MADVEQELAATEEAVAGEVRIVLDELAEEIAAHLADAREIVAARFSLGRIATMWRERVPRLMRRLFGVAEQAAEQAVSDTDGELPDGWDDLPARYDVGTLPALLGDYAEATEHLVRAVGDRLTEAAVAALAEGLNDGEDVEQLRIRLRALFAADGAQLGETREERIARTESTRAWNASTLAAAQAMTGPDQPLVKQWQTRRDEDVRDAHDAVDGQLRRLDEPFTVAGVSMSAPGDPTAPAALTVNCRCILRLQTAERAASFDSNSSPAGDVSDSKETRVLRVTQNAEVTAADSGEHTGAMIALVPSDDDARRLALDDGEPVDELHCTLMYLGEAADWTDEQRNELIGVLRTAVDADLTGPVRARAFGVNMWNPASDEPAWVYAVSDTPDSDGPDLRLAHLVAVDALERTHERPETPRPHSPWVAHVTAAYSTETWPLAPMTERLGDVTFDRLRIAFAGSYTDIPLGPEEDTPMEETTASEYTPPVRTWSTPGDAALAWENQQTGDGRIFAAGALHWDSGPWPLQYADEMGMGHEGAELAGAIQQMERDSDRLTGTGVLYLTQRAGYEAELLLDQDAPLGVSVDLDDVSIELWDNTADADEVSEGEDGGLVLAAAAYPRLSVLSLGADGWMLTADRPAEWTAAGVAMTRTRQTTSVISGPGGRIPADAARTLFPGALTAAAGDPDDPDTGVVIHAENSGDYLVRITRARVRGATLVAMPAYSTARIVLDPIEPVDEGEPVQAADTAEVAGDLDRVVAHVCSSPVPVGPRDVAQALALTMSTTKRLLRAAVSAERIVRIAHGLYTAPSTIPEGEMAAAAAVQDELAVPGIDSELEASAWRVMQQQPPMPAEWFREPTLAELPPGSGGVHYKDGRVYGWVAQAGVPHAVHGRKVQIEKLGRLDLSNFLRARFALDDGTEIAVGTITMNVGHHRDGWQCETAACQFDDSGTVAGIVTVGQNNRGLWFSGAAAPWLSEWDLSVFRSCQPSYHMTQGSGGKWQLRAVLSVPVPAHPSQMDPSYRLAAAAHLAATAVVERSNLALTAAAVALDTAAAPVTEAVPVAAPLVEPEPQHDRAPDVAPAATAPIAEHEPAATAPADVAETAAQLVASSLLAGTEFLDRFLDAVEQRQTERARMSAELDELTQRVEPARP
ncbi:phage minor head protein [Streptomyces sp. NPDC126510]|uniref:phage minor head protein n=1 Tax=Streptomyces sp. NPDC126510 TaxID=3155317 RepID=UPI00331C6681